MTDTITHETMTQAAAHGLGIGHLSPGQTWAAHIIGIPADRLQEPMEPIVREALADVERVARSQFFDDVAPDDAEAMIQRAHDEAHPMFLRGPILETMHEGMAKFFPSLKASGVDEEGRPLFNLADIAQALGASEEDLLAHAETMGIADQLRTTPPKPLH
jgi:hypothetical protein